ncbi:MAG: phosphogluconate dehydrogenase C-terminal domain-containing protein [Halobacteriaceae archaeon]
MATTLTVLGAGGKMGCRIVDQLRDDDAYDLRAVEPAEPGRERLRERGVEATDQAAALDGADAVVMAVPDEVMSDVARAVVPALEAGAMVVLLDPAVAYAGALPEREDVSYFVTHPCHPPLYGDETDPEAQADLFGGQGLATQDVVCALDQGPESDYARGEALARDIYAPVDEAHRVTTEQMAILEPALVETLTGTCLSVIREGMDRAVEMGVPEEAARSFLLGHVRIETAVIMGLTDFPLSDAAQEAIAAAKPKVFREDWEENVFDREAIAESAADIAGTSE